MKEAIIRQNVKDIANKYYPLLASEVNITKITKKLDELLNSGLNLGPYAYSWLYAEVHRLFILESFKHARYPFT